jgi:uncharacterized membrane protein YbhN (UPF0104 family)
VTRSRWLLALVIAVTAPFAVGFVLRFPWAHTLQAIGSADWALLFSASLANLASLGAKGWAWHLLLRPAAPHRWRSAETATIVGAAVNSVSVSVSGEAARAQLVAARDDVPLAPALASLVWARVVEAMALVILLAVALLVLPGTQALHDVDLAVWGLLGAGLLGWRLGLARRLLRRVPERWRFALALPEPAAGRAFLAAPLFLSAVNWVAQWLTYHWTIAATHANASPVVSLAALVAANVGGAFRVTPGNVGVLQASLMVGLAAFGVPSDQALAAGLVLQAVQVVPVIGLGVALLGVHGFRRASAKRAGAVGAA